MTQKHGIKDSALGSLDAGDRVPPWLEKWAALTLQFVEEEQALLPPQLCAIPPPQAFYTPSSAAIEARGADSGPEGTRDSAATLASMLAARLVTAGRQLKRFSCHEALHTCLRSFEAGYVAT